MKHVKFAAAWHCQTAGAVMSTLVINSQARKLILTSLASLIEFIIVVDS